MRSVRPIRFRPTMAGGTYRATILPERLLAGVSVRGVLNFPIVLLRLERGAMALWNSQHPITRDQLQARGYTPEHLAAAVEAELAKPGRVFPGAPARPVLLLMACPAIADVGEEVAHA